MGAGRGGRSPVPSGPSFGPYTQPMERTLAGSSFPGLRSGCRGRRTLPWGGAPFSRPLVHVDEARIHGGLAAGHVPVSGRRRAWTPAGGVGLAYVLRTRNPSL